jgi:hypothetical protein
MTDEMWLIAAVRLAGSLPVLRWPFWGGLLAIAVDQSDLFMMNLLDLGGVRDYQTFDKYLDQVYLLAFLAVALRWEGPERLVAVALYAYRFLGFLVFELTQSRDVLLFFPNLFESWFLLVAACRQFGWAQHDFPFAVDLQERVLVRKTAPSPWRATAIEPYQGALDMRVLTVAMVPLVALKLAQEYAIHYRRWLDSFTAVEVVQAVWRWLTGPLT